MRIRDWSSDVCSSDRMVGEGGGGDQHAVRALAEAGGEGAAGIDPMAVEPDVEVAAVAALGSEPVAELRRRLLLALTSVGEGKRVAVRVDLGGGRFIKKKNDLSK